MLAKTKLNTIELLNYRALIDSCISDNEFVLVNNVLKEYCDMKKRSQKLKDFNSTSEILVYL